MPIERVGNYRLTVEGRKREREGERCEAVSRHTLCGPLHSALVADNNVVAGESGRASLLCAALHALAVSSVALDGENKVAHSGAVAGHSDEVRPVLCQGDMDRAGVAVVGARCVVVGGNAGETVAGARADCKHCVHGRDSVAGRNVIIVGVRGRELEPKRGARRTQTTERAVDLALCRVVRWARARLVHHHSALAARANRRRRRRHVAGLLGDREVVAASGSSGQEYLCCEMDTTPHDP